MSDIYSLSGSRNVSHSGDVHSGVCPVCGAAFSYVGRGSTYIKQKGQRRAVCRWSCQAKWEKEERKRLIKVVEEQEAKAESLYQAHDRMRIQMGELTKTIKELEDNADAISRKLNDPAMPMALAAPMRASYSQLMRQIEKQRAEQANLRYEMDKVHRQHNVLLRTITIRRDQIRWMIKDR